MHPDKIVIGALNTKTNNLVKNIFAYFENKERIKLFTKNSSRRRFGASI